MAGTTLPRCPRHPPGFQEAPKLPRDREDEVRWAAGSQSPREGAAVESPRCGNNGRCAHAAPLLVELRQRPLQAPGKPLQRAASTQKHIIIYVNENECKQIVGMSVNITSFFFQGIPSVITFCLSVHKFFLLQTGHY